MDVGMFLMPAHAPSTSHYDNAQWDLQMIKWAEELGFTECWIGEHFTSPWEPVPAPDLLIAQALMQTERIRLAAGAHLLPYHHPAELAHRVAYLDHLSKGRLMMGVGSSGLPGDWALFDVDGFGGENRDMTAEALDMILRLWTDDEPFEMKGKYWTVRGIEPMFTHLKHYMRPFQTPHPPIGVAGLNAPSPTLAMAGEKGFIPMSLNLGTEYVRSHWDSIEEGAIRGGRIADRSQWRLAKEVFVADTDEEAWELAVNGFMGRYAREYIIDIFGQFEFLHFFKHDQEVPDSAITPEYFGEHNWLIGSPDTVARKLDELNTAVGGFGTLLALGYDYSDKPQAWKHSMELLTGEVLPRVEHLKAVV